MLTDCPDPKEVADFHFLQIRTLKIAKENESVPAPKHVNILAAASKYGLLFVGLEQGFKVLKLETILAIDANKENRSIEENYSCAFVPSGTPVVLSINANQTTLAACVKSATGVIINLYNTSTYPGSSGTWLPFSTNAISTPGVEVRDFAWNPAIESWYAVCFSDGSLQIHEVAGTSIKAIGSLQTANAMSVCWSPKGKQLVVGKDNGYFSQYKPNLQEVKTIVPPALEDSPVSATSICWIANTVFAVVYVVGDSPNLFIVSCPKDSPVTYSNFYDVCFGNNCAPEQKYFLHLESQWGILVCASLDSIEVAVLGDMPNWVQWDLKEDGKALLPGKDGATHAIGMAVMYSAQEQLIISESETYPPMPVMFLLTNNGLLVSFHMINSNKAAASLVSPPLALENEKKFENDMSAGVTAQVVSTQPSSTSNSPAVSSTLTMGKQIANDQSPISQNREALNVNAATFGQMQNSSTPPLSSIPKEPLNVFGNEMNVMKKPEVPFNENPKTQDKTLMSMNPLVSAVEKRNEIHSSTQNSYMTAIISGIQSFEKELQDLKQLQSSAPSIDGEDDMVSLQVFASNLHNFQKDIFETMQSLSSDIFTLKNVLLESFVMVEEACSRERRRNDHSYITMLKERALDPITAKRMQKMNQHYQYLSTQLQEVSDKLDQDWINLLSNRKKSFKSNPCISSTEAIYKTIANNQKIIYNLKKKVEILQEKADLQRFQNTAKSTRHGRYKKSMPEDLSKLADEFLKVKITYPEEGEIAMTVKLSTGSQSILKEFLQQSNIATVRPTAVYSVSQSRLLSNAAISEDFSASDQDHEKDISPQQKSPTLNEKEASKLASEASEAVTSFKSSSFESAAKPYAPVCEPISPPAVANTSVPANKTFTASNILGTSMMNKKYSEQYSYPQCFPKVPSTEDSSVKDCTNLGAVSSVSSGVKSSIEGPPNVSCAVLGKSLASNQTSLESISTASTTMPFLRTFSAVPSIQKVTECPASKVNNSTVTSVVPSFPFESSFGQKKEIAFSISHLAQSAASPRPIKINPQPETNNLFSSENSQITVSEIPIPALSTNVSTVPSSQNTNFTLPSTKTYQVSSSFFTVPESKNSTLFSLSGEKVQTDTSQAKSSTENFFQKSSDNVDQHNTLSLIKEITSESSGTPSVTADKIPTLVLNPFNKTDFVDSKSSSSQLSNVEQPVITQSTSNTFLFNQIPSVSSSQKTEDSVTANSQSVVANTLSNFSDLKQSLSPSDLSLSKPSVPVSETVVSNVPQLSSSETVPISSVSPSVTSSVSIISQSNPAVSKPPTPPMPTTSVTPAALFGPNVTVTSTTNSETSPVVTTAPPVFGIKSTSLFGPPTSESTSFFSTVKTEAPTYDQTSITPATPTPFGQAASNSNFPASSGGFFSQTLSFGPAAVATTTSSDGNNQTSFSFAKPAFGQAPGSFGLAKSFFGQNTTSFTQAGTASSFSFGSNPTSGQSVFGQGSFFSGLGGKPSEENASKNVFGLNNNVKPSTDTNLFRNSSVTSFGAVNSGSFSGTGSFSSGGGSVAQAGFGSFQQTTTQQPGGFGSAPSFGGAPAFGSPPAFGSAPAFGSGNALSSSLFGQQQQQQQQVSSNFSNFANASSPTFGSLASQNPSFGNSSPPIGGFGSPSSTFGSAPVFGGSSFGGQSSSFGSPSSPPSNSSAFTQWRN